MSRASRAGWIPALLVWSACQSSSSLYEWDGYEDSVYTVTAGDADVGAEIARIQKALQRGADEDKKAPPGMHAHLGYLYLIDGDPDNAAAAFETERELYPESTAFIDGLLERLGANQ